MKTIKKCSEIKFQIFIPHTFHFLLADWWSFLLIKKIATRVNYMISLCLYRLNRHVSLSRVWLRKENSCCAFIHIYVYTGIREWRLWANDFISSHLDGSLSRCRSYGIISFHRSVTGKRAELSGWITRRVNCFYRTLSIPVYIFSHTHNHSCNPIGRDSLEREIEKSLLNTLCNCTPIQSRLNISF